jgi:hypothetical protein
VYFETMHVGGLGAIQGVPEDRAFFNKQCQFLSRGKAAPSTVRFRRSCSTLNDRSSLIRSTRCCTGEEGPIPQPIAQPTHTEITRHGGIGEYILDRDTIGSNEQQCASFARKREAHVIGTTRWTAIEPKQTVFARRDHQGFHHMLTTDHRKAHPVQVDRARARIVHFDPIRRAAIRSDKRVPIGRLQFVDDQVGLTEQRAGQIGDEKKKRDPHRPKLGERNKVGVIARHAA